MNSKLVKILDKDLIRNIATLGYFSSYPVKEFYVEGDSVLIVGKSDHLWAHIVSSNEGELSAILEKHHRRVKYYHSVEDWMIPCILKHRALDWILSTNRYILDDSVKCDSSEIETVKIEPAFASFLHQNSLYKNSTSVEYIEERLNRGISVGIMHDKQLVAWGLTHDDDSLGFLHVLEEYRKKGYGKAILLDLIHQKRNEGKPVFGNIEPENSRSIGLVSRLDFEVQQTALI